MTARSPHFLAVLLMAIPVWGQVPDPDPTAQVDPPKHTCGEYMKLVDAEDGRADVRTVWAHGYHSALSGVDEQSAPITPESVGKFANDLQAICRDDPNKLFLIAVKEVRK